MTLAFPIARYRFELEAATSLRLPEYAGSALRGAFGHALRQLACTTRARNCEGCLLGGTCPYPAIFAPPPRPNSLSAIATPPVPYIIEPPQWGVRDYAPGEVISFGFTLIGHATEYLPLCIMAWQRAFARGVGAGDGTAELLRVLSINATSETCIHRPGESIAPHDKQAELENTPAPESITLNFTTPLRLQENGHALPPARLTPYPLLTALIRRASLLSEYHGDGPLWGTAEFSRLGEQARRIAGQHDFTWRDWIRRSSRQQQTMNFGGCIGAWTLQGDLDPFWPAIRLGEWLHVGKETSFGMGGYQICGHKFLPPDLFCENPMQQSNEKGEKTTRR